MQLKVLKMNKIIKKYFYLDKKQSYKMTKYSHSGVEVMELPDGNKVLAQITASMKAGNDTPLWFEIIPYDITKMRSELFYKETQYEAIDIAVMNQNRRLRCEDLLKKIQDQGYKEFFVAHNLNYHSYVKSTYSEQDAIELVLDNDCGCYYYIQLPDGRNSDGDKTGGFILNRSSEPRKYYAMNAQMGDIAGFRPLSDLFDVRILCTRQKS
jgi:hypothetical protein